MSEYGQHQKIKYGDIIYIEFTLQKNRYILRANSFNITGKCFVEVDQLNLNNDNIFYKNFINNLFMIFPAMKDDYIKNQSALKERLASVKDNLKNKLSFEDNIEIKEDTTKLIHDFQKTKQEIYSEKDNFLTELGQPICFKKEFILIHFDSQNFVQINEEELYNSKNNSKLILTDTYSDDCIFLFNSWSSLDNNAKYVFSNQNLYICRKEKNLWSNNNHFLMAKEIQVKANESLMNNNINTNLNMNSNYNDSTKNDIDRFVDMQRRRQKSSYISRHVFLENRNKDEQSKNEINNVYEPQEVKMEKKYILSFIENRSNGGAFKIKICSNYIDPSSGLLSFSSPVWLACQNIERHLTITPNINDPLVMLKKKDIKKRLNSDYDNNYIEKVDTKKRRFSTKGANFRYSEKALKRREKKEKKNNKEIISFDSIDKNSLNNIYGLFYVEQCETQENLKDLPDDFLRNKIPMKIDLKMSSFVQYHKIVRFLHATTRKYLSFKENEKDKNLTTININNKSSDLNNDKTFGELTLVDKPDPNCNWMFMESYKILDEKDYYTAKGYGIEFGNREKQGDEKNLNENEENKKGKKKGHDKKNGGEKENEENKKGKKKGHDKKEGGEKENEDTRVYKIKNKEILRIFHVKSKKFLCFENIYDKIMGSGAVQKSIRGDIYKGNVDLEEKSIIVDQLSLSKTPYDSDLIRLIPSNSDQSWEIRLVLYYSELLTTKIQAIINFDCEQLVKNIPAQKRLSKDFFNNSIENNFSIMNRSSLQPKEKKTDDRLKNLKENLYILKECFQNLTAYCLNNYSRKYDITMSPGKPIFYRQQFLCDQKFLENTFLFLINANTIREKIEKIEDAPQNLGIGGENNNQKKEKAFPKASTKSVKKYFGSKNLTVDDKKKIIKYLNDSIKLSFEFISAMCKDHPENKKKVFENKDLFLDYLLDYEKASKCFLDIIKDNENFMNLLSKENNENNESQKENKGNLDDDSNGNVIGKVISYLNKIDRYDLKNLSTLSKFLKTGDVGITSNQQYIFEEIFINGQDRFLIKVKPLYDDIQLLVVFKNGDNYVQKTLEEFSNSQKQDVIQYLAVQLNLFADLCYGRNYVCIDKIRELFPLDHLIYHISKTELNQEILAGLINILNFVYIDIEPHSITVYPSLIKVINNDLKIERVNKGKVRSYIPLDKLNLILCLSLFILNNIKYGKIIVNKANINMIFNIIKLRLYENVIYSPMDIEEVENENLNRKLHNLKKEVKDNIIHGEEIMIKNSNYNNKNDGEKVEKNNEEEEDIEIEGGNEDLIDSDIIEPTNEKNKNIKKLNVNNIKNSNSFYNKFGFKYIEFNFENPTGEEYLLFVLDRINDFFLNSLIINNIDYNTENKNIISQNFKSGNNNDILTQSNINFLMKSLTDLKHIFSSDKNIQNIEYKPILKQIEKVINYILDIKKEDMSIYLLENIFNANKDLLEKIFLDNNSEEIDLFSKLKKQFYDSENINAILLDDEYYYYQLFNHINCSYNIPKFFSSINYNDNNPNILLEGNNNEKMNSNLLDNSLFSEDRNQEKILDFSDLEYINKGKNKISKDLAQYKDDDYFYFKINSPNEEINLDNFFMNSVIFKNLQELIIRILEMNVDDKITKILIRMFTRLMSQRKELFDCIKNVLLLYKKEDLDKYYKCNVAILELGLLAEKTEKWMTRDRVLDNIKAYRDLDEVNINEIKNEQKDFFAVYLTLYKFIHMLIDKKTGGYLSLKEVKLIQTIFHSFQIVNILSALLREITQEFPDYNKDKKKENNINNVTKMNLTINNDVIKEEEISIVKNKEKINEKDYRLKNKEFNYKTALEKLIKEIFQLFEALVHKSSPNQSIIEVIEFTQTYSYFKDLGFNKLITELSYDSNFVKLKTDFLIDRLKEQLALNDFNEIKQNFFEFAEIKEYKKQREYKILLKKTILTLKLMKNLIIRITDNQYLSILITKFVEINDKFDIFKKTDKKDVLNKEDIFSIKNIEDNKKNSLYLYTLQFAYYFLSIAFRLAKKSQRLKDYIYTLLNLNNIKKIIIDIPSPFEKEKLEELLKLKLEISTKLYPKLKYYYKLKSVGIEIYYCLGQHILFQMNNINNNITELNNIIIQDIVYINNPKLLNRNKDKFVRKNQINLESEENDIIDEELNINEKYIIKDPFELILASFRKTLYKYFYKAIFPIIYKLKNCFKGSQDPSFDLNASDRKLFRFFKEYLLKEYDKDIFGKVLKFIKKIEPNLQKYFEHIKNQDYWSVDYSHYETNINIYYKNFMSLKKKNIIFDNKEQEILFQMVMAFTTDLIKDIENNEIVNESIGNESKILAQILKSKINFHSLLKRSAKENEVNEDLVESNQNQEREIHLVNIFLKFIQENYMKSKYSNEINSLIVLMADIIEVTPEILPYGIESIEYIFFFKDKTSELKEIFTNHVQKLFLNNGSIDIFIKIACEGNKILNDDTFPIIIHFFNNALEGGNTDVQKKFTQLFQSLPNSDNFFCYINEFLNKDIFKYLKNSSSIVEPKIDMENLTIIKDILRFLQLLAENHNIILQNFLRDQTTNRLSYNFVNILVEYLSMLLGKLSNINENSQEFSEYFINLYFQRFLSVLDTICEFLQGPCEKNQEFLISTKIIESFDKILGEIILNPKLYVTGKKEGELDNAKREETSELLSTTLGYDYRKTSRLEGFIGGEETRTTRKIDIKKKHPFENKLFAKLTDYEKSLLIFKISLVFLSIIEGRKTKDNVIKKVLRDFDYKLIFQKSVDIYLKLKDNLKFFLYIDDNIQNIEKGELDHLIVAEAGFNLYFLIQSLLSFENEDTEFKKYCIFLNPENKLSKEQIELYDHYNELKEAMNFYSNNSLSIEISKEGVVFKVYCPKLPFFNGFDEKLRKNFEDTAKRTSNPTKLMSLMNEKDKIYQKIKQLSSLEDFFKNISIFRILFNYPGYVQTVGFLLIVIMNLLIFFGYNAEKGKNNKKFLDEGGKIVKYVEFPGIDYEVSGYILIVLGCIIAVFSLIKLFEFITREAILIFKTLYTSELKEMYETAISTMSDLEIHKVDYFFVTSSYRKARIYISLLLDIKVFYALAYLIFAILGIVEHNFFFAFHLIEFIISQPILQYVFRAIVDPIAQLAYTFIFFFILIYFYSLIIFYYFQDIMPDYSCDSPAICMVFIYSNTFTSGGNLGNFIDEKHENSDGDMVRYALDISYTIIMVWLVWQMVSGLIVDTFESLRGTREDKEDDMKSTCFICDLDKEEIEKYYRGKEGFERHLKDHSVFNYFFYTFYLEDKDSSEYSGLESYIKDQIDNESISWFPNKNSLKIEEWKNKHKSNHDS